MSELNEQSRTQIVALGQELGDLALSGEIIGAIVVYINANGTVDLKACGIGPREALGTIELMSELLKRKLLA